MVGCCFCRNRCCMQNDCNKYMWRFSRGMKISQLDFSRYLNREGPLMQQSSYQQIHNSNELQGDKYRFKCIANISECRINNFLI